MKNFLRRAASLALATAFTAGIASCGTQTNLEQGLENSEQINALAKKKGGSKWLHIVHLAADNNLYKFGLEDVNEMEEGLTSPDVKVIVLFDGAKQGDSCVYDIKHDSDKATITSPKIDNPVAKAGSEIDSGDKVLAGKFLDWAVKTYPAEHIAYTLWNHGSGWRAKTKNSQVNKPVRTLIAQNPGEITTADHCWDDNGSHMTTPDLTTTIAPVVKASGQKFDILNFDACLMAHVEVAYEVKDTVNYLVASEKTEPGAGNPYQLMMAGLSKNPGMSGADYAKAIVKDYGTSYNNSGVTLSATDNAKLVSSLVPAINNFAKAASSNLSKDAAALGELRGKTASFENSDCRDIGHFASMVAADSRVSSDVKSAAAAVAAAVNETVIENHNSANKSAKGLVMYFPGKGMSLNPKYSKLSFASQGWDEFLGGFIK